jgi:hypothetical protein
VTIIADYDARTGVERELVLRLASLLWRIGRATSIETDLLRIQAEILRDRQNARESAPQSEQVPAQRRVPLSQGRHPSARDGLTEVLVRSVGLVIWLSLHVC